jgi:hypothetical protein
MTLTDFQLYRLSYYEEAVGTLYQLEKDNDLLVAHIGKIALALPFEMEEKLRAHLSKRIGILHTDIPRKSYLIRVAE